MSFSIQLSTDLISLEAGVNTPLTVQIINRDEAADRFEMEVEGLDPEWTAVPVPLFTVAGGESQSEKAFFVPPRVSESLAGNYPFVVKVRSLNSGEARTAQGVLQIKPYNHLSMEIVPKKGVVSPIRSEEIFHATIMNLGNGDHTLQLFGSDPEDAFAFEFEQQQITIGPGQQREVQVVATTTSSRPFANPRLHVFTVSARSISNPSLVVSSQAQIEQKPFMTPGVLATVVLVLVLFFGWWHFKPQPPSLDMLTIDPPQAMVGETMVVKWKASNAKSVSLNLNDQTTSVEPEGSRTLVAKQSGTVEATALGDHSEQSRPRVVSYTVTQPVAAPDPVIETFEITPHTIASGQPLLVHYKVNEATVKVTLGPINQVLDPKIDTVQIKPDQTGSLSYTLYAENASGKTVTQTVSVRVNESSQATVVFFKVAPQKVDLSGGGTSGTVKVSWQLANAAKAQLSVNGELMDLPSPISGDQDVPVTKNTEFILLGYDTKGVVTHSKKIYVKVLLPPPPPPTDTSGATTGITPSTTSPTTGTTGTPPTTTAGGR